MGLFKTILYSKVWVPIGPVFAKEIIVRLIWLTRHTNPFIGYWGEVPGNGGGGAALSECWNKVTCDKEMR